MKGFNETKDHSKRMSMICKKCSVVTDKNVRERNKDSFLSAINNNKW